MTKPLVTAAITAYNAEASIVMALESALAQDWPRLEMLVVDDASNDETVSKVQTFVQQHGCASRPIRLIRQSRNGGVARARNRLIQEAQGDFIAFFDDDDVSAPDRISRQYARIREVETALGRNMVVCHTAREQLFPDGHTYYERTMGCEGEPVPVGHAVADRVLFGRLSTGVIGSCATCSQMARKSVYTRLEGFDVALPRSEDTDLNVRCALREGAFAGIAEPLVRQTMTVGTEKSIAAEFEAYIALQDKYRDYLAERGWLDFALRWREVRRASLQGRMGRFSLRVAALALREPVKLAQKAYWSIPARHTRRHQRQWHASVFHAAAPESRSG